MNSRVDKYEIDSLEDTSSRTSRNQKLYKEIGKAELEEYEVKSNATVLGDNKDSIDVEKIKSILDTHYNDAPKRRTIEIEEPVRETTNNPIFETKEYDINVILDKAKENKNDSYEEERNKKLRAEQYEILKNLDVPKDDNEEEEDSDKELTDLINTITIHEEKEFKKSLENKKQKEDSLELDLFADLKGEDGTVVLNGIDKETEKEIDGEKIEEPKEEKEEEKKSKTTSFDDSFFTKSNAIKAKDYEDFKDLAMDEEDEKSSLFMKIVIAILLIIFLVGIVILVKSLL